MFESVGLSILCCLSVDPFYLSVDTTLQEVNIEASDATRRFNDGRKVPGSENPDSGGPRDSRRSQTVFRCLLGSWGEIVRKPATEGQIGRDARLIRAA